MLYLTAYPIPIGSANALHAPFPICFADAHSRNKQQCHVDAMCITGLGIYSASIKEHRHFLHAMPDVPNMLMLSQPKKKADPLAEG